MSNHFGLMLSLIFLSLFIVFSGEVLAYQQNSAKVIANSNQIAIYLEQNGLSNYDEFYELEALRYFNGCSVDYKKDTTNHITTYTLVTRKKYTSFSKIYSFMSKDIMCKIIICRKENYGWV